MGYLVWPYPDKNGHLVMNIERAKLIDGWMSELELIWLASQAKLYNRILEVGAYKGRTTRVLLDNTLFGTIHVIDSWKPYITSEPDAASNHMNNDASAIFSEFLQNTSDVGHRLVINICSFERYSFTEPFDFIFIDANHDYKNVKHDIRKAKSLLVKDGLLAGHDYDAGYPGVIKAVDELAPLKKTVERIWYEYQ